MNTDILLKVKKPTLLVDLQKVNSNIAVMNAKAKKNKVLLRPHFKTHQSASIAEYYRKVGITAITVSSVDMARYFAAAGWQDILIAFPLNWREMDEINGLAGKVRLAVLIDNPESADFLVRHTQHDLLIWIKIDTGLHRAGIWWEDTQKIEELIRILQRSSKLNVQGILTHAGQTYFAASSVEAKEMAFASKQAMLKVKEELKKDGMSDLQISIGDTPGCSLLDDFEGVDEIRPGNFIFFDLEQWKLGACKAEQIAVAVACPIVSKNSSRGELVIYGGAIHFSKESLKYNGKMIYGMVAGKYNEMFGEIQPDCVLTITTQEHGVLAVNALAFSQYKIGDVIQVFPVHSCLAVQALGEYLDIQTGSSLSTMVTKKDSV